MGSATVKENLGAGQYKVVIDQDTSGVEIKVQEIEQDISKLIDLFRADSIPTKQAEVNTKLTEYNASKAQQNVLLTELNALLNAATKDFQAIAAKQTQVQNQLKVLKGIEAEYRDLLRELSLLNLKLLSLQKTLKVWQDMLDSIEEDERVVWAADYSSVIEVNAKVGTIEVNGESRKVPVDYAGNAESGKVEYVHITAGGATGDGLVTPGLALTPESHYVAKATKPGWQKWKPTFRTGTITLINYVANTCSVTLDNQKSEEVKIQNSKNANGEETEKTYFDINKYTSLTNVPIEYMACDSTPFHVGTHVLIIFDSQSWENPRVIGFAEEPMPCNIKLQFKFTSTVREPDFNTYIDDRIAQIDVMINHLEYFRDTFLPDFYTHIDGLKAYTKAVYGYGLIEGWADEDLKAYKDPWVKWQNQDYTYWRADLNLAKTQLRNAKLASIGLANALKGIIYGCIDPNDDMYDVSLEDFVITLNACSTTLTETEDIDTTGMSQWEIAEQLSKWGEQLWKEKVSLDSDKLDELEAECDTQIAALQVTINDLQTRKETAQAEFDATQSALTNANATLTILVNEVNTLLTAVPPDSGAIAAKRSEAEIASTAKWTAEAAYDIAMNTLNEIQTDLEDAQRRQGLWKGIKAKIQEINSLESQTPVNEDAIIEKKEDINEDLKELKTGDACSPETHVKMYVAEFASFEADVRAAFGRSSDPNDTAMKLYLITTNHEGYMYSMPNGWIENMRWIFDLTYTETETNKKVTQEFLNYPTLSEYCVATINLPERGTIKDLTMAFRLAGRGAYIPEDFGLSIIPWVTDPDLAPYNFAKGDPMTIASGFTFGQTMLQVEDGLFWNGIRSVEMGGAQFVRGNRAINWAMGKYESHPFGSGVDSLPVTEKTDEERLEELEEINRFVNQEYQYKRDALYSDSWSIMERYGIGYGDCEDQALTKLDLLLRRGWSIKNLFIELGAIQRSNSIPGPTQYDGHAWLTVIWVNELGDTEEYILDNNYSGDLYTRDQVRTKWPDNGLIQVSGNRWQDLDYSGDVVKLGTITEIERYPHRDILTPVVQINGTVEIVETTT